MKRFKDWDREISSWKYLISKDLFYQITWSASLHSEIPQRTLMVNSCSRTGCSLHRSRWQMPLLLFSRWQMLLKRKLKVLAAQLCPTLCDPTDYSPSGSSVHGILQARILEWVAISFSRASSWFRDRIWVSFIASGLSTIWANLQLTLCSLQLEKSPHSSKDPAQPKINFKNYF